MKIFKDQNANVLTTTVDVLTVLDITALTSAQCESLECGDVVIFNNSGAKNTYTVTFKDSTNLSLTYADSTGAKEVKYAKSDDTWSYDETVTKVFGEGGGSSVGGASKYQMIPSVAFNPLLSGNYTLNQNMVDIDVSALIDFLDENNVDLDVEIVKPANFGIDTTLYFFGSGSDNVPFYINIYSDGSDVPWEVFFGSINSGTELGLLIYQTNEVKTIRDILTDFASNNIEYNLNEISEQIYFSNVFLYYYWDENQHDRAISYALTNIDEYIPLIFTNPHTESQPA